VCDATVLAGDVVDAICGEKEALLEEAMLLDRYVGEKVESGKQNLTFRMVYRSADKTLKDKAVNKIHTRLTEMLLSRFNASLQ
ncbi:MAG: hypothetical protein MI742_08685, partial [Desulfobacterales bacterium]|nr:hypothetical protein [Desulfobacterales bacterium]